MELSTINLVHVPFTLQGTTRMSMKLHTPLIKTGGYTPVILATLMMTGMCSS